MPIIALTATLASPYALADCDAGFSPPDPDCDSEPPEDAEPGEGRYRWVGGTRDWFDPDNWNREDVPFGDATVIIDGAPAFIGRGDAEMIQRLWIGYESDGEVTVGADEPPIITGSIEANQVAVGIGADGTLNIVDGGEVSSNGELYIGVHQGSRGVVNVVGSESMLAVGQNAFVGFDSAGFLNVTDDAQATIAGSLVLGHESGGVGTLDVSGAGAVEVEGAALIGNDGEGRVVITGGSVDVASTVILGANAGGLGLVNLSGTNSRLSVAENLVIGRRGGGALSLSDGATLEAQGILIAAEEGSTGRLVVGAQRDELGVTPGELLVDLIAFGTGDGELVFNHTSRDWEFAGNISGDGHLYQSGIGSTTILTGIAAHTGGTTIEAGTLQIGNGGTQGALAGDVLNQGTLRFYRSDAWLFDGDITGSGRLIQRGEGTTVLAGNAHHTGGTVIENGALQVGNGGTTGSLSGDVVNNTALIFNRADAWRFDGTLTGDGILVQAGTGTTIITGGAAHTGGTRIDAGTLQIGDGSVLGSLSGDVLNNSTLRFAHSGAWEFGGTIAGTGQLVQGGTGTTILTGVAAHTGGSAIEAGTLQIGNGGTEGALAGDVLNQGTLRFNRSDAWLFDGDITGSGRVIQGGEGTTVLAGNAHHTGGTRIENGALQVGNGDTTGSLAGDVINNSTLIFNRSDAYEFSGDMTGNGELIQAGVGRTTLGGDLSGFDGETWAMSGEIVIEGRLGGDVTVMTAARLAGSGAIGGDLNNGGLLALGAAGSLAVDGDYVGANGVLQVNPSSDPLTVAGAVTGLTFVEIETLGGEDAATGSGASDGISIVQARDGHAGAFRFAGENSYRSVGPWRYRIRAFGPDESDLSQIDSDLAGLAGFWDYRLQATAAPQVSGYQLLPTAATAAGLSQTRGVHARLGRMEHMGTMRRETYQTPRSGELWVRTMGSDGDYAASSGPEFDLNSRYLEVGGNWVNWTTGESGEWRIGGFLAAENTRGESAVSSAQTEVDGQTAGATFTWRNDRGVYFDATARFATLSSDVTTQDGVSAEPDGSRMSVSAEYGHAFQRGEWVIEPSILAVLQRVSFDDFVDSEGIIATGLDAQTMNISAAGRMQRTWRFGGSENPRVVSVYLDGRIGHELRGDERIVLSDVAFGSDVGGTSATLMAGISAQVGPRFAVYGEVGRQWVISGSGWDRLSGSLGARFNF